MNGPTEDRNIAVVERWLAAFDRRWPEPAELEALLTEDVRFIDRPSLVNPAGGERSLAGMLHGMDTGRTLLAWQSYEVRDHVAAGDTVVTRFRWSGELAVTAGPLPAGSRLTAWCVAHYVVRDGRIAHIEQHDCYELPAPGGTT